MEKTLEQFIVDNFEALDGTTEDLGNTIDVWSQDGDTLLFSITNYGNNENYTILLWHNDNSSLKSETEYLEPTENELVKAVQDILDNFDEYIPEIKEEK